MRLQVTSNIEEWAVAIARFAKATGKTMKQALREQARLLALRLIRFTPPDGQPQGKARVEKDIRKVFVGFTAPIRRHRVKGEEVAQVWARKDGTVYGVEMNLFRPDATFAEMRAHHERYRGSNGTVTKAGGYQERQVGRWRFINRMVVPESTLADFIERKQANVGMAKGGWAAALEGLGGQASKWVAKWKRAGRFRDRLDDQGYLLFDNRSPWGTNGARSARVVHNALASRARDMLKAVEHAQRKEIADLKRRIK